MEISAYNLSRFRGNLTKRREAEFVRPDAPRTALQIIRAAASSMRLSGWMDMDRSPHGSVCGRIQGSPTREGPLIGHKDLASMAIGDAKLGAQER